MIRRTRTGLLAGVLASVLVGSALVAGCTSDADPSATPSDSNAASGEVQPVTGPGAPTTDDPALDVALSEPVEDSVYPEVGDPGVDALAYDLDLAWTPATRTLTAVETLVFRATTSADRFQLDLSQSLKVSGATLDGEDVTVAHRGKNLVVRQPVEADQRYTLVLEFSTRHPRPVAAPTTRSDFSTLGWTTTDTGATWTMQEPYGAYSWYAVNDQPSDKALYSFTISVPSPFVGVANGVLVDRSEDDGITTTRWELDSPAASYLVTVAIDGFAMVEDESSSGVPITYWTGPADVSGCAVCVSRPRRSTGWRRSSGPTPSTRWAWCSSTPAVAWRPRP